MGEFRARHCIEWGLYGVRVHFRSDAALFPNYFGLVITGTGDDAANDFNKYKMLRNLKRIMTQLQLTPIVEISESEVVLFKCI